MIEKLQRRLTFLFTAATGVILTLVLLFAYFYQSRAKLHQNDALFQNYLLDFTHRLESTSNFTDEWLAKVEADGRLIIHMEDNGIPLFFSGSWNPPTDRKTLIELARLEAEKEGVYTNIRPYSASLKKSSVFSLQGEQHDSYLCTVIVLSVADGFRSLVLLADTTLLHKELLLQTAFFLFWNFSVFLHSFL